MVKKSMNPALIAVVVLLIVLIGVVVYTNSKESYTTTDGFWDNIPYRGDNYDIQCKLPNGRYKPRNTFKCIPKTPLGRHIYMETVRFMRNKVNRGIRSHIYQIEDRYNNCNGQAALCTSEGEFLDAKKRQYGGNQIVGNRPSPPCREYCGPILRSETLSRTATLGNMSQRGPAPRMRRGPAPPENPNSYAKGPVPRMRRGPAPPENPNSYAKGPAPRMRRGPAPPENPNSYFKAPQ